MRQKRAILLLSLIVAPACAISRPCHEAGDTTWAESLKGDQYCRQKKAKDGVFRNHGRYRRIDSKRRLILEGEFNWGEKHGKWIQYNPETGKPVREIEYQNGIEARKREFNQGNNPVPLPENSPEKLDERARERE